MSGAGGPSPEGGLRPNLRPLLLLTAIFFVNFMSRIIQAPMMPLIEEQLNLTHGGAGSLFLTISIGYFITLVGSSFVCSRITHRQAVLLSITAVGIALLGTSLSNGLWGIRFGLLSLGMAAGLYLPSGIATLTTLVDIRHWGKAIAIHELAPNLSFVAAPLVAEVFLAWFSWRLAFAVLGIAALVLSVVFYRFGRGGEFRGDVPSRSSVGSLVGRPAYWILVLLFGLGISSTMGIYTMLPLFLVTEHDITRHVANTLVSLSRISGLVMALVGGWAVDRFGIKAVLRAVLVLTGAATLGIAVADRGVVQVLVFLQPVLAVSFFPAGLAAVSRVSPPNLRNLAVSLVSPLGFLIGGGLVPTLIGISGDLASFSLGIAVVGTLIAVGALLPGLLKYADQSKMT